MWSDWLKLTPTKILHRFGRFLHPQRHWALFHPAEQDDGTISLHSEPARTHERCQCLCSSRLWTFSLSCFLSLDVQMSKGISPSLKYTARLDAPKFSWMALPAGRKSEFHPSSSLTNDLFPGFPTWKPSFQGKIKCMLESLVKVFNNTHKTYLTNWCTVSWIRPSDMVFRLNSFSTYKSYELVF